MAYNDTGKGKGSRSGDARNVKKFPVDKNFGGKDFSGRQPFRKGGQSSRPGEEKGGTFKKPHFSRTDNAGDKSHNGKQNSQSGRSYTGKSGFSGGRKPRPDWKKDYDRIPPSAASAAGQNAAPIPEGEEDETDGGAYDPTEGLVIGRSAVRELLRSGRTVDKLLVHRGEREGSIVMLVAEAIEQGIPVVEVDRTKLDEMAGFVPHQGVIAMVAQKEYCTVEDILALAKERNETPLIVIADGITDPYNLGALIRCAEGVGAHGLIIPKRRAVGLTALVAKSSAGAMEHMAVAKVSNIAATIKTLKQAGIWCYAAEAGGKPHYETDLARPCALVFGSEGDGVSRVVKQVCDGVISIPMYGKVNSFNVSTAAAVVLCEAARQQHNRSDAR